MMWIGIGIAVGIVAFALLWFVAYLRAERMSKRVFDRLMNEESEFERKRQERKAEFWERRRSMADWEKGFRTKQDARRDLFTEQPSVEFGGNRKNTPEVQIELIQCELTHALNHLDKGEVDLAHLAIRDAIGHCEP